MPRPPHFSPSVSVIPGAVYSSQAERMRAWKGELYPLHVGDTWLSPAEGCRMEDLRAADHPELHRYAPIQGLPSLIDAIVERTRARTGVATEREDVLVTTGATGGLGAIMGALLAPGDEVLLLAPYWPLVAGIVASFHGVPVAVPFLDVRGPEELLAAVRAKAGPRTVALYVNTPNNPTGKVLPRAWVEALAEEARRQGWWLIGDEVYEDYVYVGEHVSTRALAPERTFSAYSFSKAYGMAGNRCGHVVGPTEAMGHLRKVSTHSFYATPTAAQVVATRVLGSVGDAWVANASARYREVGNEAARRLGVPPPEGSTFLFLDVSAHLDARGLPSFMETCAERGLLLSPGPSFGPFPHHVRLCFTCVPPEVALRGVDVLAGLLSPRRPVSR
ncbi:pyridoxal phosphate-dependent aminotransferase [Corallococcus sp. H22C18031201]|uniref:pyridoxal phosphate-dependent aminotransferase n=1 Tax=Citreicoccus inhibens TaxID=2849499 RepID=UPI000E7577F7|nr:pyridoxal phosphate-dependent aminotransferase [Citreicoccus inhibens]MBU8898636.1 pyridoxal phosphate-dependent aminotransferase [Citreicoccus inhibens]RJS15996.1 pyridoxal phosphate-dependent aminotransferase [Corallococcus sp. H22C18031201]